MAVPAPWPEYQTLVVGSACLVKQILERLDVTAAIDAALTAQPEIGTTYGALAQVIVVNRMTFDPQPLYRLASWAARHGIDRLFHLQASWLDDDRLGALLEGIAKYQVNIWSAVLRTAHARFPLDLQWLHADTTSIYFEGAYDSPPTAPATAQERIPRLVEGYNKDGQRGKLQLVLSLITTGRLPLWFRPWDGNQNDDPVYLADMTALRKALLLPENSVLIGDRKLANQETMVTFCQQGQQFLAAHPWTQAAKTAWQSTQEQLQAGALAWTPVAYATRNDARKPLEERPTYAVVELPRQLRDPKTGTDYSVRFVFSWSSIKAQHDAKAREEAVASGEAALERIASLLGKYDYREKTKIEQRLAHALRKAKALAYFDYRLEPIEAKPYFVLQYGLRQEVIAEAARFDGIALLVTNVPLPRLSAAEVMMKYKEQVVVEQTIDFLKSPVQIRPMWLHSPKRIAGLTLLIMMAVLVAGLLEATVRHWIRETGELLVGLMPERRDNAYPTAKAMLRAFADYALVWVRQSDGSEAVHYPKLHPVQQQIWEILRLPPLPA